MTQPTPPASGKISERLLGTLFILSFGLATLGFLIIIDRPNWFHIRPVSTVAKAMFVAGHAEDSQPAKAGTRSGN